MSNTQPMTAYDTFCLYLAIKNHFTKESYDFFQYGGKTRVSKETFINRKDRFQFQKLSRKYNADEMRDFILSNFLHDDHFWVGNLLESEAKDRYDAYVKRKQSLSYIFDSETTKIFLSDSDPKELFKCRSGLPPIIDLYLQNEISIETLTLLNLFVGFFQKCNSKLSDDFIWPKVRMKCLKFLPFMEFDKNKIKTILKKNLESHIYT